MRLRASEWIKILGVVIGLVLGFGGWTIRLETRLTAIESKLEMQGLIIGRVSDLERRVHDLELGFAQLPPDNFESDYDRLKAWAISQGYKP